jgi:riboflavin kinase/FMN adenylyltransferase
MTEFKVLHSPEDWESIYGPAKSSVVSVGNFDGVHLGHQKILRGVVQRAAALGAIGAAITFDPHPLKVLRPEQAPQLLQTLEQRISGFAELGLDAAMVIKFDSALAQLSPEEFVRRYFAGPLRAKFVLVGHSFRFGHKQAGSAATLKGLGEQFGFAVEIVEPVIAGGEIVSSSLVRSGLSQGEVERAARLLGRPFVLTGNIHGGAGRGRTILVPTLNLAPEQELLPKSGVYATESVVAGRIYRSATNIGSRPTFDNGPLSVESHLFDFSETITSGRMEVRFWQRLRDEMKFSGADALKKQIAVDLEQTREFFRHLDVRTPTPQAAETSTE